MDHRCNRKRAPQLGKLGSARRCDERQSSGVRARSARPRNWPWRLCLVATLAIACGAAPCACHRSAPPAEPAPAFASTEASSPPPPTRPRPALVLVLVIDQLPWWSFEAARPHLAGGLRRLIDEGVLLQGEYPYASTLTAPGHATLGTGTPPAASGIFSNRRFDRQRGRVVEAVEDPDAPLLVIDPDVPPQGNDSGASSLQLQVEGIADVLRASTAGRAKSVAISFKDRGAILLLGKRPDLAVWYDPRQAAMTTSRFYTATPPTWLRALAEQEPAAKRAAWTWDPSDTERLARASGQPDDAGGEDQAFGFDHVFPHPLHPEHAAKALGLTPAGDALLLQTARAALEAEGLGDDDVPDVLGISFSSHDKAGHLWGQESWERWDVLFRLDEALGAFFEMLDDRYGSEGWALVLTSDHGAAPRVELDPEHRSRLPGRELAQQVQDAARRVLGSGTWVAHAEGSMLWLSDDFFARPPAERARAKKAMLAVAEAMDGIEGAFDAEAISGNCKSRSGLEALVCWSLPDAVGPDLVFVPHYGSVISFWNGGTSHGSPHEYDRQVPVILRTPGFEVVSGDEPVDMLRIAATITSLLGVSAPPATEGPSLLREREP